MRQALFLIDTCLSMKIQPFKWCQVNSQFLQPICNLSEMVQVVACCLKAKSHFLIKQSIPITVIGPYELHLKKLQQILLAYGFPQLWPVVQKCPQGSLSPFYHLASNAISLRYTLLIWKLNKLYITIKCYIYIYTYVIPWNKNIWIIVLYEWHMWTQTEFCKKRLSVKVFVASTSKLWHGWIIISI